MRRTLVWPPVLEGGRAAMTPDPDEDAPDSGMCLRQTIALGLLDGESTHPWGDRQVPDATFDRRSIQDAPRRRARIVERFRRLERDRRARLISVEELQAPAGEILIRVLYEDLESGERMSFEA